MIGPDELDELFKKLRSSRPGFLAEPIVLDYDRFARHPLVKKSLEIDYGVSWHRFDEETKQIVRFPKHRISWVNDIGVLYAVELYPDDRRSCYIIGYFPDEDHVEKAMSGWSEVGAVVRAGDFKLILGCPHGFTVVATARVLDQMLTAAS